MDWLRYRDSILDCYKVCGLDYVIHVGAWYGISARTLGGSMLRVKSVLFRCM